MNHESKRHVVTHVIQQLTLGGAARALVATSKYSSLNGPFDHQVISLVPSTPDGRELAQENGVHVIENVSESEVQKILRDSDIVHLNWWNNPQMARLLRSDLPEMRVLNWYHVAGDHSPQLITPSIAGFADVNIATNPYTFRANPHLAPYRSAEGVGKLRMILDPADLARVESVKLKDHIGFNVGYIGTVDFFKMHRDYISMSSSVQLPDVQFLVCGGGIQEKLREEARSVNAEGKFQFLGYVKDICPVLEVLDVYGYPLCEGTYASGELNLQEVMASGIPPVVFPYGGVKDIIKNQHNGIIVDSPKEYTEAIEFLYHNPEFRLRLGRNAREIAWQEFGAENAAEKLNGIYGELLETPKSKKVWGLESGVHILRSNSLQSHDSRIPVAFEGAEVFCDSLWDDSEYFRMSAGSPEIEDKVEGDKKLFNFPDQIHDVGILPYIGGYPNDPYLHYWSGLFWFSRKEYEKSQQAFIQSVQQGHPDFRPHAALSVVAEILSNTSLKDEALGNCYKLESQELCSSFISFLKQHFLSEMGAGLEDHFEKAKECMDKGAWNDASAILHQVWENNGDSIPVLESLATCSIESGDFDGASKWLKKAIAIENCPTILNFQLSQLEKALGRNQDAIHWASRYGDLEASPDPTFHKYFGQLLFETEDFGAAAKSFHQAVQSDNADWESYFFMAHCLVKKGELEAAKDLTRIVLEINPDYQPAHQLLAMLDDREQSNLKNLEEDVSNDFYQDFLAIETAEEANQFVLENTELRPNQKEYLLYKGIQRFPDSTLFFEQAGIYELTNGEIEKAKSLFLKVVELDHQSESGWTYLAQCAFSSGAFEELEQYLHKAFQINPKSLDGNHVLALLHMQNEQYIEAAKLFHALIVQEPCVEDYYQGLKQCFSVLGDQESVSDIENRILELRSASQSVDSADSDIQLMTPGEEQKDTEDGAPIVSVIVSTYNSEAYISDCLDDLINQTIFDNIEVLVVDSGSEQNEAEIVKKYQSSHPNIRYFRTEREPLYDSWNRAIGLSHGKYITNANTDDAHPSNALELLVQALENDPQSDLAYGDVFWTDKPNGTHENDSVIREVKYGSYDPVEAMVFCPTGCHPIWRKSVFEKLGFFNSEFKVIGDYEFLLRFVEAGLKAIHVDGFTSYFYQNEEGLTHKNKGHDQEIGPLFDRFRPRVPIGKLIKVQSTGNSRKDEAHAWAALGTRLSEGIMVPWHKEPAYHWDYAFLCFNKALTLDPDLWAARVNMCFAASLCSRQDIVEEHFQLLPENKKEGILTGLQIRKPLWEPFFSQSIDCSSNSSVSHHSSSDVKLVSSEESNGLSHITIPLRWEGPLFNESGFASEAHMFLFSLYDQGLRPGIHNIGYKISQRFLNGLPAEYRRRLFEMRDHFGDLNRGIIVQTGDSNLMPLSGADHLVGRVMFETDTLPSNWIQKCNQMDELWVTGQPQAEAYLRSGISPRKIHILNGAVDESLFNPNACQKIDLETGRTFNFFAIFEWIYRKGWDVLFESYFREFSSQDDVCLILRAYLPGVKAQNSKQKILSEISRIAEKVGKRKSDLPKVKILDDVIPTHQLANYYHSVDCVLSPSRGEGWGRPQQEAMLMGLPVISTGWGGNMEFMSPETNYLIDYKLKPVRNVEPFFWDYTESQWAEPNHEHLSQLMRHVVDSPEESLQIGTRARHHILNNFGRDKVLSQLGNHLERIQDQVQKSTISFSALSFDAPTSSSKDAKPLDIVMEGSHLDFGSLSKVNREFLKAFKNDKGIRWSAVETSQTGLINKTQLDKFDLKSGDIKSRTPNKSDFVIRHQWPPNWNASVDRPVVMIQPWEFGRIPQEWVEATKSDSIEEIWCYSRAVVHAYEDSGVDPSKLRRIPLGIDSETYSPEGDEISLQTEKKIRLLFVGGTIHRKGPDVLLDAYCKSFTHSDDVCLVIKDFGGNSVYEGQTLTEQIKKLQSNPDNPEILYLNEEMTELEMAALYRACDLLVHPYRGEGFGLPVLEAMSCGLPVVVTSGGSTDDFVSDDIGWKIPSVRSSIGNQVSQMHLAGDGWLLEPQSEALCSILKSIYHSPESLSQKGALASEWVLKNYTWGHSAKHIIRGFNEIQEKRAKKLQDVTPEENEIKLPGVAHIAKLDQAWAEFEKRNLESAVEKVTCSLSQRPFHPEAYELLAEICIENNDFQAADRFCKKLRKIAPGFKKAKKLSKRIKQSRSVSQPRIPLELPNIEETNRLSVCLIAKNEEEHIERCLSSIRDFAHEIIVVDTGSTDRTIELAQSMGARIIHWAWNDHFSDARNKSIENATGDWILILDADEEIPADQVDTLKQHLADESVMAFRLPIVDKGKEDEGTNFVPRLFKNAPGLFFIGRIHEQIFSSIEVRRQEWGLSSKFGQATLLHHGYTDEMNTDRDKITRNLRLLELALDELPGDPNLLMNLGLELCRGGNPSVGVRYYMKAFDRLDKLPKDHITPEIRETLLHQLSSYMLKIRSFKGIIDLSNRRLAKMGSLTSSFLFSLGLAHMETGDIESAIKTFESCISRKNEDSYTVTNPEVLKGGPYHCLGMCLEKKGDFENALRYYGEGLGISPKSGAIQNDFLRIAREQTLHIKAVEILNSKMFDGEDSQVLWAMGSILCAENPATFQFGLEWTREAKKYFPFDKMICDSRYQLLIECGEFEALIEETEAAVGQLSPATFAGVVWARLLTGYNIPTVPPVDEKAVSQELILWYRKWVNAGAEQLIREINGKVDVLQSTYPSAFQILNHVLAQIA